MSDAVILRELYIIRHGESYGNLDDYKPATLQEGCDPLLTETGMMQAAKLGRYLSSIDFDDVYSSGLRRAAMTAAEIVKYQKSGKPLNLLPDLCEAFIDPNYKGLSYEEEKNLLQGIGVKYAGGYPEGCRLTIPDETPREHEERYFERAGRVIDYIESKYNGGEKIALVSHAGFMTYIIFYLMGYRDAEPLYYDIRLSNTGVTKITFYEHGTYRYGDMVIDYINRNNHLD